MKNHQGIKIDAGKARRPWTAWWPIPSGWQELNWQELNRVCLSIEPLGLVLTRSDMEVP